MYRYEDFRKYLASDEGQRAVLKTHDKAVSLLAASGAVTMSCLMPSGDNWQAMAVVERLVEMGDIREVTTPDCLARVFMEAGGVGTLVDQIRRRR